MGRIRTIKPEFPQSESMGNISRDARLCFILIWTLADDSGRLRGDSRLLASLLFPYDSDAQNLMPSWLRELENQNSIKCYSVGGYNYVQVINWRDHQKIDKPSGSKLPEFVEDSTNARGGFETILEESPMARERSSEDQGPRTKEGTKDQGNAREDRNVAEDSRSNGHAGQDDLIFLGEIPENWRDKPGAEKLNNLWKAWVDHCLKVHGSRVSAGDLADVFAMTVDTMVQGQNALEVLNAAITFGIEKKLAAITSAMITTESGKIQARSKDPTKYSKTGYELGVTGDILVPFEKVHKAHG